MHMRPPYDPDVNRSMRVITGICINVTGMADKDSPHPGARRCCAPFNKRGEVDGEECFYKGKFGRGVLCAGRHFGSVV
jgi:hypothetical protein